MPPKKTASVKARTQLEKDLPKIVTGLKESKDKRNHTLAKDIEKLIVGLKKFDISKQVEEKKKEKKEKKTTTKTTTSTKKKETKTSEKRIVVVTGGREKLKFEGYPNKSALIKHMQRTYPDFEFTDSARAHPSIFLVPKEGMQPSPHKLKPLKDKAYAVLTVEAFAKRYG
jgi:hypothetical protein